MHDFLSSSAQQAGISFRSVPGKSLYVGISGGSLLHTSAAKIRGKISIENELTCVNIRRLNTSTWLVCPDYPLRSKFAKTARHLILICMIKAGLHIIFAGFLRRNDNSQPETAPKTVSFPILVSSNQRAE